LSSVLLLDKRINCFQVQHFYIIRLN